MVQTRRLFLYCLLPTAYCLLFAVYCFRVAGLMVFDLEPEEVLDGGEGRGALRGDADAATALRLFEGVSNLGLQARHRVGAGRHTRVDEHRRVEVSRGEHLRDVREVLP